MNLLPSSPQPVDRIKDVDEVVSIVRVEANEQFPVEQIDEGVCFVQISALEEFPVEDGWLPCEPVDNRPGPGGFLHQIVALRHEAIPRTTFSRVGAIQHALATPFEGTQQFAAMRRRW